MTDGWSDETAYGWHMALLAASEPSADDGEALRTPQQAAAAAAAAAQPPPPRRMLRFWARVASREASLRAGAC